MPADANRALGAQFFLEQDRLRGGPAESLCSATYLATIGTYPPMPLAGHQQFATMFYSAFPDLSHTIEETVADDDSVAVRFVLRGTHRGAFMGVPASGRQIDIPAMAILRVSDGRVERLHGIFDSLTMMQQLGAVSG